MTHCIKLLRLVLYGLVTIFPIEICQSSSKIDKKESFQDTIVSLKL